ncbi:MAG: pyruvate kinase [Holosporales bacterium]|jgi:pyruvate kinase|nr:pyruvate kinase [Holosporales bacterium]
MKKLFIVTSCVIFAIITLKFAACDAFSPKMSSKQIEKFEQKEDFVASTASLRSGIFTIRKTKVVATLGPASSSEDMIRRLIAAGVNVFRLNFSHGTHETHKNNASIIRKIEVEIGTKLTIMADLQGPKIRIGAFENGKILLKTGDVFTLDLSEELGNRKRVSLPHPEIFEALNVGTELLLDDGRIKLRVVASNKKEIKTTVVDGGMLSDRKGVNIPNAILPIAALTKKDKEDIDVINGMDVDLVAISFVQTADDLLNARKIINKDIMIVAKIEKPSAVQNIDSIIEVADAIMVARGDLGVELRYELVPSTQKILINKARYYRKPVIVATQMLESMVSAPVPTRAEVSDVASAVVQGADAVMLSAETASGAYPEEAVKAMVRTIFQAENDGIGAMVENHANATAMSEAIAKIVEKEEIKYIIVQTESEHMVTDIANSRPKAKIIALTTDVKVLRRLGLVWGICAICTDEMRDFLKIERTIQGVLSNFGIGEGERIAIVTDGQSEQPVQPLLSCNYGICVSTVRNLKEKTRT